MAPKKQPSHRPTKEKVEEKPPKPSSPDDEEEDDEVEEQSQEQSETDGDASSEEQEQQQKQKEQLVKIPAPKFANGSDSGSGSESESEDVNPSAYKVQPIMPKPAPAKRAHQETDDSTNTSKKLKTTEAKRDEKKTTPATPGASGAGCITRLWSEEDEIAVLKGMVEFKVQKGVDPSADMAGLHGFVKEKLKVDFSKDQLKSKIVRLKKKFANASKRGENAVFSSPYEILVFMLAERIWGAGAGNVSESGVGKVSKGDVGKVSKSGGDATNDEDAKKNAVVGRKEENGVVTEEVVVRKEGDGEEFWSKYPFLRASFDSVGGNYPSLVKYDLVKENLSFIGSDKAKDLDDRWRKLFWEETQLNYKMLGLINEQVEMALNQ